MESDEKIENLTFISVLWVSLKSTQPALLFIHYVEQLQAYRSYQNSISGKRAPKTKEQKNSICSQSDSNFRLKTYIDHIKDFFFSQRKLRCTWKQRKKFKNLIHSYTISKSIIQWNGYAGSVFASHKFSEERF